MPDIHEILPNDFLFVDELKNLKFCTDNTNNPPQQEEANTLIDYMLEHIPKTEHFFTEIVRSIYSIYRECMPNADGATNKDVTGLY